MPRPDSVTQEDILRWDEIIDSDPLISVGMAQNPIVREVCYAGQWLVERLDELDCPDHLIGRIMYTAAGLCFGRKDFWAIHQEIFDKFKDGSLEFAMDPEETN